MIATLVGAPENNSGNAFLSTSTSERLFRIEHTQEEFHFITDLNSEQVYILDQSWYGQELNQAKGAMLHGLGMSTNGQFGELGEYLNSLDESGELNYENDERRDTLVQDEVMPNHQRLFKQNSLSLSENSPSHDRVLKKRSFGHASEYSPQHKTSFDYNLHKLSRNPLSSCRSQSSSNLSRSSEEFPQPMRTTAESRSDSEMAVDGKDDADLKPIAEERDEYDEKSSNQSHRQQTSTPRKKLSNNIHLQLHSHISSLREVQGFVLFPHHPSPSVNSRLSQCFLFESSLILFLN
ncbi:hypothetical protein Ciccas_004649 [Cichlidogyrus casuarinus]|uniref:Diacylglycerol kinase iota-like domain-containing protein n=1 Tax=Cichlidogyrus casuarinus TaxID=1844966 RepID=A0ABD2QAZ6_9PLAT